MMLSAACSLTAQFAIVQRISVSPFTLLRLAMPLLIVAFTIMALAELAGDVVDRDDGPRLRDGHGRSGLHGRRVAGGFAEEQGSVAGVAGSCGPLGFTLGPLLGGALYQLDPALPYAVAAGMYLLLFVSMRWIGKRVAVHDAGT